MATRESLDDILTEMDAAIAEEPESFTLRADFDNLRMTIARKSIAMAEAIDKHPQLYEVVRKMVQGFYTYGRVHSVDANDIEIKGFMTPDGNIVVQLRHDPWASVR